MIAPQHFIFMIIAQKTLACISGLLLLVNFGKADELYDLSNAINHLSRAIEDLGDPPVYVPSREEQEEQYKEWKAYCERMDAEQRAYDAWNKKFMAEVAEHYKHE